MATIQGPKIQVPPALSEMFEFRYGEDGRIEGASLKQDWAAFFNSAQQTIYNVSRSGPTGSRPTSTVPGRFIGMPYFDTTLNAQVSLKSINPDVWVTAGGSTTSAGVTSIDVSSYGIQSFTGGPVTSTGVIAGVWSGTSGGIPYFSSAAFLSSSAVLTSSAVMVGGGSGGAPHTIAALTANQMLIGTTGDPVARTVSGDVTLSSSGAVTMSTVNANVGTFGDVSHVGQFTVNGKGLITAASSVAFSAGGYVAPTVTTYTVSSGTFLTNTSALFLLIELVGGGGGGGAQATNNGTAGSTTTFGSLSSGGGGGGLAGGVVSNGGGGGSATGGDVNIIGSSGQGGAGSLSQSSAGGQGGSSYLGGNGSGGAVTAVGTAATANSGSGGGGAGASGSSGSAGGGGSGGFVRKIITSPASSYAYAVGAAGSGGSAGGAAGGNGAAGIVYVETHFQ